MKLITLTHANVGTKIDIVAGLVAGYYWSPGAKATFVVASGGAIFPAAESPEEVRKILQNGENNAAKEAASNGNEES